MLVNRIDKYSVTFFKKLIFYRVQRDKRVKYCCHPPLHPPIFCCHFLKTLSPTLPKLVNWILLSPPPLSADPATRPQHNKTEDLLIHFQLVKYDSERKKSSVLCFYKTDSCPGTREHRHRPAQSSG